MAGRDAGRWDWQLAVRAGLGKGPKDTDSPPEAKIIDSTAVDGKGRIDATFPLGAKFWVQLGRVDPEDPTKFWSLETNAKFTLKNAKPKPEVADALFPNNVVIEYRRTRRTTSSTFRRYIWAR